jgi:hypothetical protein
LPIWRRGNAFAVSALHFFATSAVAADALSIIGATMMQTTKSARPNFRLVSVAYLLALLQVGKWVERPAIANYASAVFVSPDDYFRGRV